MSKILKQLELDKNKYYETHLSLINCILPVQMTPMEIKLLARFMSFTGDMAEERFGTTARKIVKESLDIKPAGMSNYLRGLKTKGFIYEVNDKFTILPILFPKQNIQEYMFKLINKG
jgi:hypothetical protein